MSNLKFDQKTANEYEKGIRRTLPTYDAMYKMTHSYLRQNVGEKASILIVGAGGGTELEVFGKGNAEWTFTAIDPSASMLDLAKVKSKELGLLNRTKFFSGTVIDLDERNLYDAATNMLVLHFIPSIEEKRETLNKINRLLKPGAPLIIASMFGEPGQEEFEEKVKLWKQYWLDRTKLNPEAMEDMEMSIRNLSFLAENDIRSLLLDAGFERMTKFMETAMFGSWICYKKKSGDE
ncbi:class I SAM-dependent methyltransferase [Chungangia koreensis]|uniref:Class I SAM-dependent methyltransferase n=1 Tax=Chungangia koreensis TaxID=752657 RepID=A0ABV8X4M1_9LACT